MPLCPVPSVGIKAVDVMVPFLDNPIATMLAPAGSLFSVYRHPDGDFVLIDGIKNESAVEPSTNRADKLVSV